MSRRTGRKRKSGIIGLAIANGYLAKEIETFPPDAYLPEWEDLRGRAPGATGALSSEAFVRELRDGWR